MLKSLLGIARQWSREKFVILSLKPQNRVRILILYIERGLFVTTMRQQNQLVKL